MRSTSSAIDMSTISMSNQTIMHRHLLLEIVAWILLLGGAFGLLFAEVLLVEAAYFCSGEFARRWWLAIFLIISIVTVLGLSGYVIVRAIQAFRQRQDSAFLKLSAVVLGLGAGEIFVAALLFAITMVLLASGSFPIHTVHVRCAQTLAKCSISK